MLHLKTVQAETEGRRADKLESLLEAERVKATRDRVKLEQAIADSARAKATVDEHVRELEHQLEHAGRVRIALEHQVGGLREKLDSLMVDYSDVVTDLPDEDGFNVPTAAARKKASTNDPNDSEEEKLRQARLTLEYETWVSKKKEQAAHAHPGMVPRSRAPTKDHPGADETSPPPVTGAPSPVNGDADAARDAPNGSHPAAKPHHPAAGSHHPVAGLHHSDGTETTRPRKKTVGGTSKPVAHPDPAAAKKKEQEAARQEAEHMAKLQQEEEEHERERAKRAEEEIARQQAEMEAQQAEEERVRAEQEAAALEAAAKAREEEEAASKKWGKKKKK
ncbi:hypothetical protein BC828DRAFT_374549 [Blastocladiella britannica]|nr:hypothetical protein BC828DRAFT_374549 [Blastocladiella britannica]